MKGFVTFMREQGVVGLAVGFILGGAVSNVVSSLVEDIINPLLGALLGKTEFAALGVRIGQDIVVSYGNFLSVILDFVIVAAVIYWIFKKLGLENLDAKKEA